MVNPLPGQVLWALTTPQGRKAAIMIVACVTFCLSLVMSCQELRYMVSGKTVDAAGALQTSTREVDGQKVQTKTLTYHYTDGSMDRENSMDVPPSFNLDASTLVKIQYISGRDASRLQGQTNKVWVYIFFGSIAVVVLGGWLLVKST